MGPLCLYFSAAVLSLAVLYKAAARLFGREKDGIDVVFTVLFFAALFVPMMKIDHADRSERENRMLAKLPSFLTENGLNTKFGEGFDRWFSDRFFGRDLLLRFHAKSVERKESGRAFAGKDGWLFYKAEGSVANFQNRKLFSEKERAKAVSFLSGFRDWCDKKNIRFLYLIAPDKNKIYGEYFAYVKKINGDDKSRANALMADLREKGVPALYFYDDLTARKNETLLYYKNDTHWTPYGAFIAYEKTAEALGIPAVRPLSYEIVKNESGDLTAMLPAAGKDPVSEYKMPVFPPPSAVCRKIKEPSEHTVCENAKGRKKAVVFHDSFTEALKPMYNATFKKVTYFWRHEITAADLDYIVKDGADIVIFEQVERYLEKLPRLAFPQGVM